MAEMLNFSVLRPFQKIGTKNLKTPGLMCYDTGSTTTLLTNLKAEKNAGKRDAMIKLAKAFHDQSSLVKDVRTLPSYLFEISSVTATLRNRATIDQFKTEVNKICSANSIPNVTAWTGTAPIKQLAENLADHVTAYAIYCTPDSRDKDTRAIITRLLRNVRLIQMIYNGAMPGNSRFGRYSSAPLALPKDCFPLPPKGNEEERKTAMKAYEAEKTIIQKQKEETLSVVSRIQSLKTAKEDIDSIYRRVSMPERVQQQIRDTEKMNAAGPKKFSGGIFSGLFSSTQKAPVATAKDDMVILTENSKTKLKESTRMVLTGMGKDMKGDIDIRSMIADLDDEIKKSSGTLKTLPSKGSTVKIGTSFVSVGWMKPKGPKGDLQFYPTPGSVGTSVPSAPEPPVVEIPSIPSGHGTVRPIGEGDLYLIREKVIRYEEGEIAHIENVLMGEKRLRRHVRRDENQVTTLFDTETSRDSEKDLQTTDRSDLQSSVERATQEKLAIQAGVDASYSGPNFEINANAGVAYDRATQESNSMARSVSQEIINRSVDIVRERVREQRTTMTKLTVTETNLHEIDNSNAPTDHVRGIYSWVNKVYLAQLVNHGRRLMFEFVVPEPAAFFKYAEATGASEGSSIEKPAPPIYKAPIIPSFIGWVNLNETDLEDRPLEPSDITDENYDRWVAKYNVQDATPPPSLYRVFSLALMEKPASSGNEVPKAVGELTIEDGYVASSAFVGGTMIPHDGGYLRMTVGRNTFEWNVSYRPNPTLVMDNETGKVPVTLVFYKIAAYGINVEITARRTDEKYQAWQLKTYASIISAYNTLKTRYDESIAAAQIQAGISIQGRNPLKNRDIEKIELKKASLSVLTAQHFDVFDAMREAHGVPQMDIEEAALEGRYIQYFEQVFEWNAMSYIFYPYFWGRKGEAASRWADAMHLTDTDAKFEKFLQAGAARVLVPVRPGYEESIIQYLATETGEIWEGGDVPQVDDEQYLSIVESAREENGNFNVPGPGDVTVTKNSANVAGTGTEFTEAADLHREIIIKGKAYKIVAVTSETAIILDRPFEDANAANTPYELGPKLIGDPWEVTIPTPLVYLKDKATTKLPLKI